MGCQSAFHAPHGAADFLAWRRRRGITEIVYDDGVMRHMVWRLSGGACDMEQLSAALRAAVASPCILTALRDELSRRAIRYERVGAGSGTGG